MVKPGFLRCATLDAGACEVPECRETGPPGKFTVMRFCSLAAIAIATFGAATVHAQDTAPATPDSLVVAAKRAAGSDYAGTFLRICVAPDNLTPRAPPPVTGPRTIPERATWYAKPYKVFDNLYFVGTLAHSAWALTTSEGIV